jgi:methylated-DNA-[protein]-cysteine S-methyltransferase
MNDRDSIFVEDPTCLFSYCASPFGELLLTSDGEALTRLSLPEPRSGVACQPRAEWARDEAGLRDVAAQLRAYFEGELRHFEIPLRLVGTEFQRAAWEQLTRIPFGATISYSEQARGMGRPGAARAVGAANGRNPIAIVVPCHRVIGANGSLTGYGGGLDRKQWLLEHEASVLGSGARQQKRRRDIAVSLFSD